MTQTIQIAPDRKIISAAGKKLAAIVAELMIHDHAVARLRGGLRLTWDRDGAAAWFALTRPAPVAPSAVEIEVTRKVAGGKLDLSGPGEIWTERVERGTQSALWHGLRWQLVVEEVKL